MSPLDLLTLSSEAQTLVRCLMREPGLTAVELSQRVNRPLADVQTILQHLIEESRLVQHAAYPDVSYQVVLESPQPRKSVLLEALFS